jgi:hypothetical protein
MLADILIPKGDVIRPVETTAPSTAARVKAPTRHEEFWNARDCPADPTRFVRRQFGYAKAVALGIIPTINP